MSELQGLQIAMEVGSYFERAPFGWVCCILLGTAEYSDEIIICRDALWISVPLSPARERG